MFFADTQILEALKLCSRCCKWIFCKFPVALWKIEEYNAVNKHIEGVFFRFSILMLEDSMNAMTLQNNMIISIILIGAIGAVKE